MGSTAEIGSEVTIVKRAAEDAGLVECDLAVKRQKGMNECVAVVGDVKRVAEMVLVLAAMGKLRAGRPPSQSEAEIMAEARGKLAQVCGLFAPKDVFSGDAFRSVIEDLGLDKLREEHQQRLGFRTHKSSISEKLLISKRKMEKSEESPVLLTPYSSGAAGDIRGTLHAARTLSSDKTNHAPLPAGNIQFASLSRDGALLNHSSISHHLPSTNVRTVVSSGFHPGHLGRDSSSIALPRVDQPHLRWDGRQNGSSHASQTHANSSSRSHPTMRTPTWSVHPSSISSVSTGKIKCDGKVPTNATIKVEGSGNFKSAVPRHSASSKLFSNQTESANSPNIHQNLQGKNFVSASSKSNIHAEIGNIVQKVLQSRSFDHPQWTVPSRDYMNKALTCQMCKSTINEMDNVLICDGCEKGYHLKCLKASNLKGIPRGEWHCGRCMSLSNGKPLPPKYGRVMRNCGAVKIPSSSLALQSSFDKKIRASDGKASQNKGMANIDVAVQKSSGTNVCNNGHPASGFIQAKSEEMRGQNTIPSRGSVKNIYLGICLSNLLNSSGAVASAASSLEQLSAKKAEELKSQPHIEYEITSASSDHTQVHNGPQHNSHIGVANSVAVTLKHSLDCDIRVDLQESSARATLDSISDDQPKYVQHGVAQANPHEISGSSILESEQSGSPTDCFHNVEWIGDALEVVNEKTYYNSCRINGLVYKILDYALIRFNSDKLIPAKLQSMWEESRTGGKWVAVNRCYFPGDLPEGVGRPCGVEYEVYESNYSSVVTANSIQSRCKVLPPSKFAEELQRRNHLESVPNDGLYPLYICNKDQGARRELLDQEEISLPSPLLVSTKKSLVDL